MIKKTPSMLSAVNKMRFLFTPHEKKKWLSITVFAFVTSFFEVLTTTAIMTFAQILYRPEMASRHFERIGLGSELPGAQITIYAALLLAFFYIIKNIVATLEIFYQNFTIQRMSSDFKHKIIQRYVGYDYAQSIGRNISYGMGVISSDAEVIFSSGFTSLAGLFSEVVVICFLFGLMIYLNPALAGVIFVVSLTVIFIASKILLPQFYHWGIALRNLSVEGSRHLMAFFTAFKEVVLLGKKEYFIKRYLVEARKISKVTAWQNSVNAMPRLPLELVFIGIFIVTIIKMCTEGKSSVEMSAVLAGYFYAGFRIMPAINRMINLSNNFKAVIPNIERVHEEYIKMSEAASYVSCPELEFRKNIELKNIFYTYPNTKRPILKNFNLVIGKGEKIGVIGETGSGKSTLSDVLLGLLRPQKGSVLVDGKYPLNCSEWHRKIGYVPQSIYLGEGTIAENIAFGEEEIDEGKLNKAIDAAQLRKLLNNLPQGFNSQAGAGGGFLSGGEKQRIAIARALYHQPEVMIFDEATSALDNETERKVMETIEKVGESRTVIMIAHRLTTLKSCDRIIEIKDGEIIRETTYDALQLAS